MGNDETGCYGESKPTMNQHFVLDSHCYNGARVPVCQRCGVKYGEVGSNQLCPKATIEVFPKCSKPFTQYVIIRRRRMTLKQYERLRRAARKMLQDVRKFVKRKRL